MMNHESDREEWGACYRIKVCMQRLFSDNRARAYVCVRPTQRVRWLRRRLRTLFALPPRFVLLSGGHLLPSDEPLAVLCRDDTVDVVPAHVDVGAGDSSDADDDGVIMRDVAPESGVGDSESSTHGPADSPASSSHAERDEDKFTAAMTPPPCAPLAATEADNELIERKRRALLMLQQYCGDRAERPRRRRVRRRRRHPLTTPPEATPPEAAAPEAAPEGVAPTCQLAPSRGKRERAGSVLRNGRERSRQPRVIRPLGQDVL